MGSVDIANQLREYYSIQLPVRKIWMPLFFWLLDTTIINSYLILKQSDKNIKQKDFRVKLVQDLIKAELEENKEKRSYTCSQQVDKLTNQFKFIQIDPIKRYQYVITNFELLLEKLSLNSHLPEWREARNSCIQYRYLIKKE